MPREVMEGKKKVKRLLSAPPETGKWVRLKNKVWICG
jgi:hypothetical protein